MRQRFFNVVFQILMLAVPCLAATAEAKATSAEMQVGATVGGSLEAQDIFYEDGQSMLRVSSTGEAAISADEGVQVSSTADGWSATASADAPHPIYLTLTY